MRRSTTGARREAAAVLAGWSRRPAAAACALLAAAGVTALLVAVGGPPSPLTHLYYLPVIFVAVVWGPWAGAGAGAIAAALAEPVALALLGRLEHVQAGSLARAGSMMLVGSVCGSLTRSLVRHVGELEELNMETIFAFARAIDARDPYTARHSEKVATYGEQLARALGLPEADCRRIHLAGLLHDVGKVALERSILHKPGPLTDEEWEQVREHPRLSAHIVGRISRFADLVPGALHHHERYDGGGYPDGLAGRSIPLDARVLAVADAYDAMTSDRSYRSGLSHREALQRLVDGAGSQFDPLCVDAFLRLDVDGAFAPEPEDAPAPGAEPVAGEAEQFVAALLRG